MDPEKFQVREVGFVGRRLSRRHPVHGPARDAGGVREEQDHLARQGAAARGQRGRGFICDLPVPEVPQNAGAGHLQGQPWLRDFLGEARQVKAGRHAADAGPIGEPVAMEGRWRRPAVAHEAGRRLRHRRWRLVRER